MRQGRINWNLIIVLFLAVIAVAITSIGLRRYHRSKRAEVGLAEGNAAYDEGRWREAASYLGQYLSVTPNDVEILLKYGKSQIRIQPFTRDALKQAINAYRNVLRIENNTEAAGELVSLYLQFGMPAEAELIARRFTADDPEGQFRQSLGISLMHQRKYDDAYEVLEELIEQHPDRVLAYKLLGDITEKRPDLTSVEPRQWYDKAVEQNPDLAQAYIFRSAFLMDHDQIEAAQQDIEKAEQCDISGSETRLTLAAAWLRHRQYDRTLRHLKAIKKDDPENMGLWQLWAALAGQMGESDQLVKVADEGQAALGEGNYDFLALAAELYIQANHIEKAQECLARLSDAQADRSTILYLEGLVAQGRAEWTEAVKKWQQAIQLGYSSETIYLNLAGTLDQINNRPMAIQILRRYVSGQEGTFRGHLRLAQLLTRDQNWQEALEQATAAVQLNPVSLEARILYFRCRIEMLDVQKEVDVAVLRQAIEGVIDTKDTASSKMLMYYLETRLERYDQAGDILEDIQQTFGRSQSLALSQARLLLLQEKHAGAFTLLGKAIQEYPSSTEMMKLLIWGYTQDKQYDKALNLLETAAQKADSAFSRRQYRQWFAEVLMLADRSDEALEVYQKMADESEGDIFARRQMLSIARKTTEASQLQQWVDEIKTAEGEDGWQWKFEQSRLWFEQKEDFQRHYSEIVKLLSENIGINTEDQASRILLASCHERAGNIQLALSMYQDATPRQSENIEFIIAAVGAMYRAQEFRQAQALLTRAAESGVWDHRLARFDLQNSLRIGREADAIALLEKIAAESPDDTDAKLSLAVLQLRSGNFEQAQTHLEQILKIHPDSAAAVAAMAELYLKQEKSDRALKLCDDYLAAYKTMQGHVMRCQVLLSMGNLKEVEAGLGVIESKYDDDINAQLIASRLYQIIGRSDKAVDLLNGLLAKSGDDFQVQKQAAFVFLSLPDATLIQKGAELLDNALQQNPGDVQLRLRKAGLLIQKKTAVSAGKAKDILTQLASEYPKLEAVWAALAQVSLLEQNPDQALDFVDRGRMYLPDSKSLSLVKAQIVGRRNPAAAIQFLETLHAKHPQDASLILLLVQNYRETQQFAKASKLLTESLSQEVLKDSILLKNAMVAIHVDSGNRQAAEALYQSLVEQSESQSVFLNWIDLLAEKADLEGIQSAYQQWVNRYPTSSDRLLTSVLTAIIKTERPDALKAAEEVVQPMIAKQPKSPVGYHAMATLLHRAQKKKDAVPWYEKTIALNPRQIVAINNLAWILCTEMEDYHKALDYAQKGLEMNPSYVDLIDTRGTILMHLERFDEAATDFQKCKEMYFKSNPNRTATIYRRGQCLLKMKQNEQAVLELMEAKDWDAVNQGLTEQQRQDIDGLIQRASQRSS